MRATLIAMWRMFHALAFYPIMIGLFLWLYFTDAHWFWGAAIIVGILIFDPIWRILAKNILRMTQNK